MFTLYAKIEATTDILVPTEFLEKRRFMDVQLYHDKEGAHPASRYPWYFSDKPTKRNKYIMHNCVKYKLEWII